MTQQLSPDEIKTFHQQGFIIKRQMLASDQVDQIRHQAELELQQNKPPYELEADLHYPGAPTSSKTNGGQTIRRLLNAYHRNTLNKNWAHHPQLTQMLEDLFDGPAYLPLAHHNCVMSKNPRFSSDSLWHQDLRYWSFSKGELITAWLALNNEHPNNGCLQVIPTSHLMTFSSDQFDQQQFFRSDLAINQAIIQKKQWVELNPGDLLFFHSRLLHAAMRNLTQETKFALVYTFHHKNDQPIAGSRSASMPSINLADENICHPSRSAK